MGLQTKLSLKPPSGRSQGRGVLKRRESSEKAKVPQSHMAHMALGSMQLELRAAARAVAADAIKRELWCYLCHCSATNTANMANHTQPAIPVSMHLPRGREPLFENLCNKVHG